MTPEDLFFIRQEWGMTQAELAEVLWGDARYQSRVSSYERGKRPIPKPVQAHLATLQAAGEVRKETS